jgi:hypothetical protein
MEEEYFASWEFEFVSQGTQYNVIEFPLKHGIYLKNASLFTLVDTLFCGYYNGDSS